MIRRILIFLMLSLFMATALVLWSSNYDASSAISEGQGTLAGYVQKVKAQTMAIASPLLRKVGIDVKDANANVIERQMENAADKVNEATQALSK